MTGYEIAQEIYEALGEPTDLDPNNAEARERYIDVINMGLKRIASWKDPVTGRYLRLPSLMGEWEFQFTPVTGVWSGDVPEGKSFTAPLAMLDNVKNGMLKLDEYYRYVVQRDGTTLYILEDFPSIETGFDWELYRNRFYIGEGLDIDTSSFTYPMVNILEIYDMTKKIKLLPAKRGNDLLRSDLNIGQAYHWVQIGDVIVFDAFFNEERWFKLEYYRMPMEISDLNNEPDLPNNLHWGLVLMGLEWGFQRSGETNEKYSVKQDIKDFFRSVKTSQDMFEDAFDNDHGVLVK